jgi:enoyl reductase
MHPMKALISIATAGLLLLQPWITYDPGPGGDTSARGSQTGDSGENLRAEIESRRIKVSGNGVRGGKGDGFRMKRPCWYEPFLNAEDMHRFFTEGRDAANRARIDEESFRAFTQQFKDKLGQKGLWWTPGYNKGDPAGAACWADLQQFLFVPPGVTPPSGITIEQLAELARAAMTVPEQTVKLNPDAKSFVNLPTHVWLEGIGETRRSVTAEIPGVMSVTLVATLQDLKIDSGTTPDRAEVTESGCGTAGKPYVKGEEFSCGVRYLRSSIDQPRETYPLTVTAVWPVEVQGDVVPFQFAPVELSVTRDVPVGEIQSNVKPPS